MLVIVTTKSFTTKFVPLKLLSFALLVFLSVSTSSLQAQKTITGEWYGVGHVKKSGGYNNYLCEMVLIRKDNKVTGIFKYFFRQDSVKIRVAGTFDARYNRLELNASPILNFKAKNSNGADCQMEGGFNLNVTKKVLTLTGQFNPLYDYRILCPAIDIQFVKYDPSKDEPVDKEMAFSDTLDAPHPPVTMAQKPAVKDTVVKKLQPLPVTKETARPAIITRDTTKLAVAKKDVAKAPVANPKPVDPTETFIKELNSRTFELVAPVIEVEADSLQVTFYDNGEIDNDTISVFYNRKPVLLKQMLSKEPVSVRFALDTSINEISMFAVNLGRIAPNTAVAIIYAGEKRFELNLTSSFATNSTIRFRKKLKHFDPRNIN